MTETDNAMQSMRIFMENMVGEALLAQRVGLACTPAEIVSASFQQIADIARDCVPLAHLLDTSDLLFHAEGPGAAHDLPWLSTLNWLTSTVEKSLRTLTSSWLDVAGVDGKKLANLVDLRLTGVAPGSLWIGTKIVPPAADLWPEDHQFAESLSHAFANLPKLVNYIGDETISSGISEVIDDPAHLDIALGVLLKLSPTGKKGVHTLDISAKNEGHASLSQRERTVLRNELRRLDRLGMKKGRFTGEVRSADLDRTRFHLRTQDGMVRCVAMELQSDQARSMLGRQVTVSGHYQEDINGKPRLLMVERIELKDKSPDAETDPTAR